MRFAPAIFAALLVLPLAACGTDAGPPCPPEAKPSGSLDFHELDIVAAGSPILMARGGFSGGGGFRAAPRATPPAPRPTTPTTRPADTSPNGWMLPFMLGVGAGSASGSANANERGCP